MNLLVCQYLVFGTPSYCDFSGLGVKHLMMMGKGSLYCLTQV